MKKIIPFLVALVFISCTDNNPKTKQEILPETTVTFDYELQEIGSTEKEILINQDIPNSPDCTLQPGDTLRLCKSYGTNDWHVESFYKGSAEVDHCEHMRSAILISIKKVSYHYKE